MKAFDCTCHKKNKDAKTQTLLTYISYKRNLTKEGVNIKQYASFALKIESKISVLSAPLADKTRFATVKSTLMVENSK